MLSIPCKPYVMINLIPYEYHWTQHSSIKTYFPLTQYTVLYWYLPAKKILCTCALMYVMILQASLALSTELGGNTSY
jgi:hypothetical protein